MGARRGGKRGRRIPPVTSTVPARSKRLLAAAGRSAGRTARTAGAITAHAIGFTNITHRHPGPSTRAPPSRIPTADESPATAPQTPRARLRSLPAVNVVVRVESAPGSINPPPAPPPTPPPPHTPDLSPSP